MKSKWEFRVDKNNQIDFRAPIEPLFHSLEDLNSFVGKTSIKYHLSKTFVFYLTTFQFLLMILNNTKLTNKMLQRDEVKEKKINFLEQINLKGWTRMSAPCHSKEDKRTCLNKHDVLTAMVYNVNH